MITRDQLRDAITSRRKKAQHSYRKHVTGRVTDLEVRILGRRGSVASTEASLRVWEYAETLIGSSAAATMTDVELGEMLVREMNRTIKNAAHVKENRTGNVSTGADYAVADARAAATARAAWDVIVIALPLGLISSQT